MHHAPATATTKCTLIYIYISLYWKWDKIRRTTTSHSPNNRVRSNHDSVSHLDGRIRQENDSSARYSPKKYRKAVANLKHVLVAPNFKKLHSQIRGESEPFPVMHIFFQHKEPIVKCKRQCQKEHGHCLSSGWNTRILEENR